MSTSKEWSFIWITEPISSNGPHSFKIKNKLFKTTFWKKYLKYYITLTKRLKNISELLSEQILALYFLSLQLSAMKFKWAGTFDVTGI